MTSNDNNETSDGLLRHPSKNLPARCFAYVGDSADPSTWRHNYLFEDGSVDKHGLELAIESFVRQYRGAQAMWGVSDEELHGVLLKLRTAAEAIGEWPCKSRLPRFMDLAQRLDELGLADK